MRVFHGSSAVFNHFDSSHFLEGEGNMAYGAGHYVSNVESTGRMYANVARSSVQLRNSHHEHIQYQIKEAKENGWRWRIPVLEKEFASIPKTAENKSVLYEVDVPDDNGGNNLDYYLTIDKSVRRKIAEKLRTLPDSMLDKEHHGPNWLRGGFDTLANVIEREQLSGGEILERISDALVGRSNEETSRVLSEAGIVGMKVQTGAQRGGDGRGMNYVIFKDSDLKIVNRVELMERPNGTVYGWAEGNKIYLTPEGMNPNTPIHEYTHLWVKAMVKNAPKEWKNIVELLKGTDVWEQVKGDKNYASLTTDDEIASEVLSRISGRENAKRMIGEAEKVIAEEMDIFEAARKQTLLNRVKKALNDFRKWVGTNLFQMHFNSIDEVTDRVLWDMLNKTDLEIGGERRKNNIEDSIKKANQTFGSTGTSVNQVARAF